MAPKFNKAKGVASSSHGNKSSRRTQEEPVEDESMLQQPPRHYGLHWVTEQEGFEEPFDDDDATDEEQVRVNSNFESDDDGDDFEMGEAIFAHTDDED
ncbi:hypothetical protein HAX54_039912 [Datura stramonium]|uniref:Uncharacterized protein n=1 Tax=Datura stramonium TaxID=4076 RepID=A0ABS8VPY0_DATST|nr:hypothetical protein [Datura stramonium]